MHRDRWRGTRRAVSLRDGRVSIHHGFDRRFGIFQHVFEAFEQVDSSSTRRRGGNGLGLALSRRLAELMGGEVGVTSQPGAGSSFWLAVRVAKVPPRGVSEVASTTGAASPACELLSRPGGFTDPVADRSRGDAGDPAVRGS